MGTFFVYIPSIHSNKHLLYITIFFFLGVVRKRWKPYKEYNILNLSEDATFTNHRSASGGTEEAFHKPGTSRKHHRSHHQYSEKFNCLRSLSLVFHELHHYKVQIRPGLDGNFKTTHFRQELLLGDIHSKLTSRADYKPTAFQVPLLRVDSSVADTLGLDSASLSKSKSLLNIDSRSTEDNTGRVYKKSYVGHFDVGTVGELDSILSSKASEEIKNERVSTDPVEIFNHCHVCSAVSTANEKSPPYLMTKVTLPLHLSGEWVSLSCEQRPMHLYLTRHFRFYTGDHTWIVEYKFFYDSICTGSSFSVTAAGHYKIGKSDQHVSGGTEVDFHVERASLTVFDLRMIENLKQDYDCGSGEWRLGVPREMSSTNGCPTLGLVVPSIEYELLRLEVDFHGSWLLYMGQADTEGKRRGAKERPTAYQPPLIQCHSLPPHSENLREILSSPLYSDDVYSNYDHRILAMDKDDSYSAAVSMHVNLSILFVCVLCIFGSSR